MKRVDWKSLGIGVFIGAVAIITMAAAESSTGYREFEYKVVAGRVFGDDLQRSMNNVGSWELVTVEAFAEQHAFAVFRRPK